MNKRQKSKPECKIHEIKIVTTYYDDVVSGRKRFELRKNDRGYKVGDTLKMQEYSKGEYTGRTIEAEIIYMLEEYTGLQEGYCILGIVPMYETVTITPKQLEGQQSIADYPEVLPESEAVANE